MIKYKYEYEMLKTDLEPNIRYHDDMCGKEVMVRDMPHRDRFSDFRIFNGVKLGDMDNILVMLKKVLMIIDKRRKEPTNFLK